MRRLASLLLALLLLAPVSALAAPPAPPTVGAAAAALLSADDGRVLWEKNGSAPMGMASTTKLMTALCALRLGDAEQMIAVPPGAVGIEGSSAYLQAGERLSLLDLLYALLLRSANDAAVVIALALCGSVQAFADEMNALSAEMGLEATHFVNPHGLDHPDHRTTAIELARIAAAAYADPLIARIMATPRHTLPATASSAPRLLINHNRLLTSDARVVGGKTGYTRACGRCLVTVAEQDGTALIAVTLSDPNDWRDHAALYDYGFAAFRTVRPSLPPPPPLPITYGKLGAIAVSAAPPPALTLPTGARVEISYRLTPLTAPVKEGQPCGQVILTVHGQPLLSLPLTAARAVERRSSPARSIPRSLARLAAWLASRFTSLFRRT